MNAHVVERTTDRVGGLQWLGPRGSQRDTFAAYDENLERGGTP